MRFIKANQLNKINEQNTEGSYFLDKSLIVNLLRLSKSLRLLESHA